MERYSGGKLEDLGSILEGSASWGEGDPVEDIKRCEETLRRDTGVKDFVTPFHSVDEYKEFFKRRDSEYGR